ncbi:MAG: hypothetical protein ACTSYB_02675, partial [Candidatus Helarchaeota archaeon]
MVSEVEQEVPVPMAEGIPAPEIGTTAEPEETDHYKKPPSDIMGFVDYIMITLFFIATFLNIVYLGSDDPAERLMAMQFMAIALLGAIGIGVKTRFDHLPLRNAYGEVI